MPRDYFDRPGLFDRGTWLLGFVRYQARGSRPAHGLCDRGSRRFGIAPHQDDGIFTLLHTDGSPGLQICPSWEGSDVHRDEAMLDDDLEWIDVPHLPGHWIVNLGTLLNRWSNARFKATLHRVVVADESSERHSLPFFYESNIDAPIECLPSCVLQEQEGVSSPLPVCTPGDILLEMAHHNGLTLTPVPEQGG